MRPLYVLHDRLLEREKGDPHSNPAEPADHAFGRSRGGYGSKVHILTDASSIPLAIGVMAAQEHESKHVEALLDQVWVPGKVGHPVQRARYVVGDKGYEGQPVRQAIEARGGIPIIPKKSNQKAEYYVDKELYRNRNMVERRIGWLAIRV